MNKSKKICFFKFSKLELAGGCENLMIENANDLLKRYNDIEINFITIDLSDHWIFKLLMSVYYLKPYVEKKRESSIDIIEKLSKKIRYINFESISELKNELKKYDYIYSKNEILELIILNLFVGFKNIKKVILSHHTTLYFNYCLSIQDHLHNFLYTGLIYKILVKNVYKHSVFTDQDKQILVNKLGFKNVFKIIRPYKLEKYDIELTEGNTLDILFLGRMSKAKGLDILIKIIDGLNISNPEMCRFIIAGSGDKHYETIIKNLALKYNNINYLGYIDNSKIDTIYRKSDIVIMPSLYETTGAMIFEGAKYGVLPIISNLPGPKEYVIDGYNGFVCDLNDEEFISSIKKCYNLKINKPEVLKEMIDNNYNVIKLKNDSDVIYEQIYRIFS